MKFTFIGDVMLGRMIGSKYAKNPYKIVDPDIAKIVKNSDFVMANLESPIPTVATTEGDHLQFSGNANALKEFNFIDCFSTANNHITDCGVDGIRETIKNLESNGFIHNGVYTHDYEPIRLQLSDSSYISIVTFTDMLNIPFPDDSEWKVPRMGDEKILDTIRMCKNQGDKVILFAHVGMLFTRFPNPVTYDYLHKCIDTGADIIVTAHSHCLGGMEVYKGKPIFHSIGDFCMDGNSKRRRTACLLQLDIDNDAVKWDIIPTKVTDNLEITLLYGAEKDKCIQGYNSVSELIRKHSDRYQQFFKKQYRKEIINHSLSTLNFIYHERGLRGMIKIVAMRAAETFRTIYWIFKDRSNDQRDDDAIKANRKKLSQQELFGK